MSFTLIASLLGGFLTLVGAALVGSRLNEGRHRKKENDVLKSNILDLTEMLERHDRITKDERNAIKNIPNVGVNDISRILHEWPEVSGSHKAKVRKTPVKKRRRKRVQKD